jgi:hypothetical protein
MREKKRPKKMMMKKKKSLSGRTRLFSIFLPFLNKSPETLDYAKQLQSLFWSVLTTTKIALFTMMIFF